jgi:hypothetical protein
MRSAKMSANAPFCNGTHQSLLRWVYKQHRGFWGMNGVATFWLCFSYWMFTFYK